MPPGGYDRPPRRQFRGVRIGRDDGPCPGCRRQSAEDEREDCLTGVRDAMLLLSCTYQSLLLGQTQPSALDVFLVVENSGRMKANDPGLSMPTAQSTSATTPHDRH